MCSDYEYNLELSTKSLMSSIRSWHPRGTIPNKGLAESVAKKPRQHQNNNHTIILSPFSRTNLGLKTISFAFRYLLLLLV